MNREVAEFIFIYIALPLVFILGVLPAYMMMPALWIVGLYAYLILKKAKEPIFSMRCDCEVMRIVWLRFLIISLLIAWFTMEFMPEHFLNFVKENPRTWLIVVVLYPFLSAFVQELVFRRFFFFRYSGWFSSKWSMFAINGLLFAYAHVVFANWIAILFSFIGGIFFAHTYMRSRSILAVSIEHALYGNLLFTLGLGYFFYHGSIG